MTLRAQRGAPLSDERISATVESVARAIAERVGVEVVDVVTEPEQITIEIEGQRIAAIGLAAELRRLTENWYRSKYGADESLWGGEDASD